MDEMPYIHFDIEADFIVFKPVIGCTLRAKVNKVSKHHIGCLVLDYFNASIPKPQNVVNGWQGFEMKIGDEFMFEVEKIYTQNKILSMRGHLPETSKKKKKKQKYINNFGVMPLNESSQGESFTEVSISDEPAKKRIKSEEADESMETSMNESATTLHNSTLNNNSGMYDTEMMSVTKKKKKTKKKHKDRESEDVNQNDFSQSSSVLDTSMCSATSDLGEDNSFTIVKGKRKRKRKNSDGLDSKLLVKIEKFDEQNDVLSSVPSENFKKLKNGTSLSSDILGKKLQPVSNNESETVSDFSLTNASEKMKKHKKHKHIKEELIDQSLNQSDILLQMTDVSGSGKMEPDRSETISDFSFTNTSEKKKKHKKHKHIKEELIDQSLSQSDVVLQMTDVNGSGKMEPDWSIEEQKSPKKRKKHKISKSIKLENDDTN